MSVVTLTGGPPDSSPLAAPVLNSATAGNRFGVPIPTLWALPYGTWYVRIAAADEYRPALITKISPLSNEQSFTLVAGVTTSALLAWTVDGSWPVGTKILMLLTQTSGNYFSPNLAIMQVTATQEASDGLGAPPNASAGSNWLSAFAGNVPQAQDYVTDFVSGFLKDGDTTDSAHDWNVSGGSEVDPITTQQVVAAIQAAKPGDVVEMEATGGSPFDWERNAYLVKRGVKLVGGVWSMGEEDFYCAGSFNVVYPAALRGGLLLGDGSRVNGPTIGMCPHAASYDFNPDPDWSGDWSLFAGALVNLSSRLGPALPEAPPDPDPANAWVNGGPSYAAHNRATSVDPDAGFRFVLDSLAGGTTLEMGAMRLEKFSLVQIQDTSRDKILAFDQVGMHDVGTFRLNPGTRYDRMTMENCLHGYEINFSTGTAVLDRCRVTGFQVSAVNYQSASDAAVRLLDFESDEDADSDSPTVRLVGWLSGGGFHSRLYIAHRLRVRVVDHLGDPVAGATVELLDGGTVLFSEASGADGWIAEQEVDRFVYTAEGAPGLPLPGPVVDTVAGHVANGYMVASQEPPYLLLVKRTGYDTVAVLVDPDRPMAMVVRPPSSILGASASVGGAVAGDVVTVVDLPVGGVGVVEVTASVEDDAVDAEVS